MSSNSPSSSPRRIPILLLKTLSQPDDTYRECFSAQPADSSSGSQYFFQPHFIPVLVHSQNISTLTQLGELLKTDELKRKYGGMIFTSQRAVEAWSDVVRHAESVPKSPQKTRDVDPFADLEQLTPFPLYVVGPATERTLQTLASTATPNSLVARLNSSIYGAHTGNGANLASYILQHYNQLYEEHWFTYFEAPRLPFIPLLGMSSQNYGRKRLEKDDQRLRKKPLLFLVGETRRDIIPRTLMGQEDGGQRIVVEELEVYATKVMDSFGEDFREKYRHLEENARDEVSANIMVVVVFSPQGSDVMLKAIGYLDENGMATKKAKLRWWQDPDGGQDGTGWIIVTIGPTTKDHLKDKLGVDPDVCAAKPSPEGLRDGIEAFLTENNIRV